MILLLSLLATSEATDVFWNGHYRSQGHLYRSLSLSQSNNNAIEQIGYANHWLSLRPVWKITSKVAVHSQLDMLYIQPFGESPVYFTDPSLDANDVGFPQSVQPTPDADGSFGSGNIQASRIWGEVNSSIGIIRFGRMPVHWGTGVVFNAGNQPTQFVGDTADRIQYSKHFDPIYVLAAVETRSEGYISETDDAYAGTVAIYYANERISAGLYNVFERQVVEEAAFGQYTVDLYGKADLGSLDVEGEFAFMYGNGDLQGGLDEVTRIAFGGALNAHLQMDNYGVGLNVGYASGDDDPEDKTFKTFAFDSNYDISLMLFDQVLPTLSPTVNNSTNNGFETGAAQTGNYIGNAIYVQPRFSYAVSETFTPAVSVLLARTARLPEDEDGNENYGAEINLDLQYEPVKHFQLLGKVGVLFPGTHFANYTDPDFGGGFNQTAYGTEVNVVVQF